MASGNRRPGSGIGKEAITVLFVHVPPELKYLVDQYRIDRRMPTLSEAVRRLFESHPDLTSIAYRLYNGIDTSPQPNPDREFP